MEKTWLQVFDLGDELCFGVIRQMFFVAANSSQAAKWFRRNVALRFSSFYFADPQALHAGTWPTQLHRNNLEHLTFSAHSEY